ncbi:MAG: DUF4232 domain-containing protein [Solirubrobacteraceae bacterium]
MCPKTTRMRLTISVAALTLTLTLAACGGSAGTSSQPSSSSAASVSSPASATSTSTSTSTTTVHTVTKTSTAVAGPPLCRGAGLALSFLGQQGATGHGELGFALRNTSGHTCKTYGYPGVLFLDRAGAPLPTASTRTTHDFFGTVAADAQVLAPGGGVSFRVGVTHLAVGSDSSAGCTTAFALQAIAPDDTATLRTPIPQGAYECRVATVSPLAPGNSAYR